jgi:formylglycine-generating enzyme required for sulfatase activity
MEVRNIGDYDLIQKVEIDGLHDTYFAEHRFLKREVICKLYHHLPSASYDKLVTLYEKIQHPHLIKPLMIEKEENLVCLVFDPFVDANHHSMNLADFLQQHEMLSEEMIFSILTQIASALDFIRQNQIGYANLKLTNCLLQNVFKDDLFVGMMDFVSIHEDKNHLLPVQLMDRYMSIWSNRSQESKEDLLKRFENTKAFFAPEIHEQNSNPYAMNTYAFGVLAYLLLTKAIPQPKMASPSKLRQLQFNWDVLIEECLKLNPKDRPDSLKKLMESVKKVEFGSPKIEVSKVHEIVTELQKTTHVKPIEAPAELKPVFKAQELIRPTFDPDPAQMFHTESVIAPYRPLEKEEKEITPIPTDMIIIPEGEYFRGSNEGARDERPAHKVFLHSYAIDVHPVTNEQFVRFLEAMGGEKDSQNNDLIRLRESRIRRSAGKLTIESGYAKHPVVGVSWYGAVGYAKWVGKRLPTEAEWEVASRSLKADMIYPTGPNIERTHANFFSADTTPVMSYPPIDIGLYDIPGNVYEWCYDWYDYNFYESSHQEPTNPKGPAQGVYRVLRGGCWKSLKDDLRCSHRHRNNPGTVNKTYGFRCAADVEAV